MRSSRTTMARLTVALSASMAASSTSRLAMMRFMPRRCRQARLVCRMVLRMASWLAASCSRRTQMAMRVRAPFRVERQRKLLRASNRSRVSEMAVEWAHRDRWALVAAGVHAMGRAPRMVWAHVMDSALEATKGSKMQRGRRTPCPLLSRAARNEQSCESGDNVN